MRIALVLLLIVLAALWKFADAVGEFCDDMMWRD